MSFSPLPLTDLSVAFRQRGELVARYASAAAEAFASCAEWLEASLAAHLDEPLTLTEGAVESGWSYEGLRRKVKEHQSLNVGTDDAPLIRRKDLPRLGAPRGPRGSYGPRSKVSGTALAPINPALPSDSSEFAQPVEATSDVAAADRAVGTEDHDDTMHASETARSRDVAVTSLDVNVAEHDAVVPAARTSMIPAGGGHRARPTQRRVRRQSAKERFNDLLDRATLR